MDTKFVRGGGPSFLRLYGSVPLILSVKDSRYYFLCSNEALSLDPSTQRSPLLENAVRDRKYKYMVPILYQKIRLRPEIMRERYGSMFNPIRFHTDWNTGVDITDVTTYSPEHMTIMEDYRGSRDAS